MGGCGGRVGQREHLIEHQHVDLPGSGVEDNECYSAGCPMISQNLDFAGLLLPCLFVHTFNYFHFGVLAGGTEMSHSVCYLLH